MDRTYNRRIHRLGGYRSGNAKICNLYFTIFGDQHVLRFNITVNDVLIMSCLDSLCNLDRNAD